MGEMTLELNSPITEEQWGILEDVDFDNTESICFHTKHGKEVEFVKRKKGRWLNINESQKWECSECGRMMWFSPRFDVKPSDYSFCPNCGAMMEESEQ